MSSRLTQDDRQAQVDGLLEWAGKTIEDIFGETRTYPPRPQMLRSLRSYDLAQLSALTGESSGRAEDMLDAMRVADAAWERMTDAEREDEAAVERAAAAMTDYTTEDGISVSDGDDGSINVGLDEDLQAWVTPEEDEDKDAGEGDTYRISTQWRAGTVGELDEARDYRHMTREDAVARAVELVREEAAARAAEAAE